MNRLTLLVVAGLLLGAGFLSARLVTVEDDDGSGMKRYFLGLIYSVEDRAEVSDEEAIAIQAGHRANIGRLMKSGEMVLAGPCEGGGDLRGLFVYNVSTRERAEELVATDPAVAAGRLRVKLYAWWGPTALEGILDPVKAEKSSAEPESADPDEHDDEDQ